MKHDRHVPHGALEILIATSDIAVDQTDVVHWNPAQHTRPAHEASHSPAIRNQRFDEMTSNESRRACYERNARALSHGVMRSSARRTFDRSCKLSLRASRAVF